MKKLIFIALFSVPTLIFAQKNSVYAEYSTHIIANSLSINYERKIFDDLFLRIGFGYYKEIEIFGISEEYYSVPISINYLFKLSAKNFIDVGIGPNIIESSFDSPGAPEKVTFLFTNVGFRRNFGNNFFWRAHLTPYVINLTKDTYSYGDTTFFVVEEFDFPKTWVGFSIGKQF